MKCNTYKNKRKTGKRKTGKTKKKKTKGKSKKRTNRRNQRAGSYTFGFNNPIINGSPEVLQYYRCYDPEPPFDRSSLVGGESCTGNTNNLKHLFKGGKCGLCGTNMKKRRTQKKSKSKKGKKGKGKKGKGKKGKGRKRSRNQRGGNESSVFTGNMTERAFGCRQPYWSPPCV
tara:strand:- start:33 stop:548 length:516 start_codon:yes stop_codon:yes gene_type:complete